ncbi:hypothetical protein GF342_02795 [Candidatus Woesearchaeota archaeon]|nr:hypothetical protein [Candidatus Woesearchaeota archaeon]
MVDIPHANYYEGILQLRNPSEELVEFVLTTVQDDERAVITKIKEVKGGLDYYISSQKYLQILGKKIKKKFWGEYKLTSTLHTQDKMGNKLYRITILFRLYDFKQGDLVLVGGEEYVVEQLRNKVQVKHVKSHKKEWVNPEQITVL